MRMLRITEEVIYVGDEDRHNAVNEVLRFGYRVGTRRQCQPVSSL